MPSCVSCGLSGLPEAAACWTSLCCATVAYCSLNTTTWLGALFGQNVRTMCWSIVGMYLLRMSSMMATALFSSVSYVDEYFSSCRASRRQKDMTPRGCFLMFASMAVSAVLHAAKQNAVTAGFSVILLTCAPSPGCVLRCLGAGCTALGTNRARACACGIWAFSHEPPVRGTSSGRSHAVKVRGGRSRVSTKQGTSNMFDAWQQSITKVRNEPGGSLRKRACNSSS
mmetsp:Transcript_12393/g.36848  ORF Transcript_12393/g.36848 Transcript_12393/m.36848 type:complete len:226 (+) Transcript_12393:508-1185(+)